MARASKAGRRTKSGRLKRDNYAGPKIVQPSEWVAAQRARFGEHYSSALGRAFASGLLGDGQIAKDRLDAGKRFSRLYSAIIDTRPYGCPLGREQRSLGGSGANFDMERAQSDQDWLFAAMKRVGHLRPWLDAMVSKEYTDAGPVWLTRLLMGGKDPYDRAMLKHCTDALDAIAPARRPVGILVSIAS